MYDDLLKRLGDEYCAGSCQTQPCLCGLLSEAKECIKELQSDLEQMIAVKDIHQKKRHENFERAESLQDEVDQLKRATSTIKLNAHVIIDRAKRDFAGVAYEHDAQAILAAIKEWNGE